LDSSINVPVSIATQFHLGKESKEGIIHVGTPSKSSYPFFVFLEILTRIDWQQKLEWWRRALRQTLPAMLRLWRRVRLFVVDLQG
jgi:hypothetical protein